jgi:transposase
VRHLVENTDLPYREITWKAGVSAGTITNWLRDFAWQRPAHAPRATDLVPNYCAGRR